jgi:hypothetical protein
VLTFDANEERLKAIYALNGVQASYALGVAFLLDTTRGLTRRLRQCGWSGCGRFSLAWEGRPRRYCSTDHYRKAEVERVQRWRRRPR